LAEASALETAELRKLVEKQNNEMKVQSRKIEALYALSQENVRNPLYSQVAQMGITQPKEA
jgi:phage portal protein BeeE